MAPATNPSGGGGGEPGQTIIDLKKAFLTTQIRLLTAPLQAPPADWQERLPEPEGGDLREGVVRDVLHKVNVILRHHSRSTYPSQTTRNVAEQIDAMYWASGERGSGGGDEEDFVGLRGLSKDVDLRVDEAIALLPESWPEEAASDHDEEEEQGNNDEALREQYRTLQTRLSDLSAQRRVIRRRLQQYKHFQRLLAPFEKAEESIVLSMLAGGADEDGELVAELKRMRELVGRVEGCLKRVDWEDRRYGDDREGGRGRIMEREKVEGIIGLR